MTNEIFEQINEFGKRSFSALKELYEINTRIAGQITEQQLACANLYVESAARQLKLASAAKGYSEIITGQTDLMNDFSKKTQGITRNNVDIISESKDEIGAWVEKYIEEAASITPFKTNDA